MLISILESKLGSRLSVAGIKRVMCYLSLIIGLSGCQTSFVTIEEISSQGVDKTIYLSGSVTHLAPFVDNAAYQLKDETGTVWVVTDQGHPHAGQTMNIKGKVHYQSLPFAQQELGDFYIVELEQLPQTPN